MSETIPTIEEARQQVEAQWERDRQQALDAAAQKVVADAQWRVMQIEAERKRDVELRAHREAEAKKAQKAWRKVFGRKIAAKLDAWTEYDLHPVEDRLFAFSSDDALEVARRSGLYIAPHADQTAVLGLNMAKHAPHLAGVDPTAEDLRELAEQIAERDREQAKGAAERAEAEERQRDREREEATFGIAVSDLPDE